MCVEGSDKGNKDLKIKPYTAQNKHPAHNNSSDRQRQ